MQQLDIALLNFMDAYSSHNQIHVFGYDQEYICKLVEVYVVDILIKPNVAYDHKYVIYLCCLIF